MARKGKKKGGSTVRVSPWWFGLVGAIAGVAVLTYFIVTSGSSGVSVPQVTSAPDPRVADLEPVATLQIEAGGEVTDAYFSPTQLTGTAGEVIEIVIANVGTISHNLTIAGVDGEYDTDDDWVSEPNLIRAGEQGSVVLKIDETGTYAFRCVLHPIVQVGQLVLR